ncbi:MAG: 3'-5' exonuclease [Desulfobacterales bacterium]|jgi:DNA polymerase-3 subunit epsilon
MFQLLGAQLHNRWIRHRLRGKKLHPLARQNLTALDRLDINQPARSLRYVVFDLETTGLNHSRDQVLSVAAFRIAEARIRLGEVFSSLANPDRSIPSAAIKIHGILPSMVVQAPNASEVYEQFLRYLGTDVLVGYHVGFDLHFINTYMRQTYGFPLQNLVLDARAMCRKIVFPPHLGSYTVRYKGDPELDAVAKLFGVEIYERHSALGDALATALIFQRILATLEKRGLKRLRNLLSISR